jgi:hypothetical protein
MTPKKGPLLTIIMGAAATPRHTPALESCGDNEHLNIAHFGINIAPHSILMSQSLSALRLRAALHLMSLEGADISNIVRAHAHSLGIPADACQPLPREIAAALDAVIALAAHGNEMCNAQSTAAVPSYEGMASGGDWFGDSALGSDFGDFAFPAFQHKESGGQMTFQVRAALRLKLFCCRFL